MVGCSPDSNSKVTQQHMVLASPALPVTAVCGVALVLSTTWLNPTKGGVRTDKPHVPQRKRSATAGTYRDPRPREKSHCEIGRCQLEMHNGSGDLPSGVEGLCPSLSKSHVQKYLQSLHMQLRIWLDLTQIHCQHLY